MKAGNGDKERVTVTVRIPEHILKQVNACIDQEELPVSRNHWIVEALVEKLKRKENGGGSNGTR
jgi:metal-responsive CopG/Arc/MetJ family transcriptional regulator